VTFSRRLLPDNLLMSSRETPRGAAAAWFPASLLLVASLLISASSAATRPAPALQSDYIEALSAADHFLQAWQSGDAESGMALLTSHAKKITTTEMVEKFFSNSNPSAYEIGRGKMLKRGRYEFPVVLVMQSPNNRVRRRFSSIIVSNTGGSDWAIDKLP
jgi:hypothetical protein